MFRHNHNSKLYKYTTEEKRHYKLYKKKKVWVVAGVLLFGPVAFVPTYISANEVNQVEVVAEAEPKTDLEQTLPTDESASTQEITATSATEVTSETSVTNAPVTSTSELIEATSDTVQTSETNLAEQTSEALPTTSESILVTTEDVSENDSVAIASENDIALTATTEEEYYTGSDVVKIQGVTNGSTLGSITTEQADDGSTVYTYHATSTGTSQTKVGMTVTYTGNKGDTFTMVVTPSNSQLTGFNNYAPTGSPQIEKLADGTIKYTWTIGGSAETSTVKQELPAAGSLFYESNASANDPYPPYQGSAGGDATILATGDYYQIDFLINGLKAPAETSAKIVLEKEFAVISSNVVDFISSGNKINGVAQVNPDTNYLYKTTLTKDTAKYSLRLKEYYLEIPVPEHFVLDEDETQKMLRTWPTGAYIMYGAISVTQPDGEGTPIVVKNIHTLAGGMTQPEIYFVGHYTSTETSGKSDIPSGWYDLGDGERQYFGKINVDTKEELATPLTGTGFNQNVLPVGSAQTTEYYSLYFRTTNDQQTSSVLIAHTPSYNSNYTDRTSMQTVGQGTIKTPISESGDPSAPVLFAVGLNAAGATSFTPTYHITLPTQITSTGITVPLNNVEDDFADYKSYNPAQTGYTVVVTGDDGSTVTQHLQAGENYNPLTGLIDHFGTFSTGEKLAEGVKIAAYDVTPDNEYFANAFQSSANSTGINDIATGMISVLGYLNTTANEDESYVVKIVVDSEKRSIPFDLTVVPIASQKLEVQGYNYPSSNVGTGTNQTVYQAGDTFTIGVQVLGKRYTPQTGVNLDAGGILTGNANRTDTDLPGHGLNVPYLTVTDPILYFTLPDQTQVTNFKNSNTFYQITKPPATGVPTPKITQTTSSDGQTVMILDWTGTGFELLPEMLITLNLKVNENAVNGFDTARTADMLYEYTESGKTKDLYTAAQLAKLGVSTDGLRAYKPNVNSESNTTWIQVGGDFSNTTLPDSYKTQIKFADGTVADTMILDAASNNAYLRIVAPAIVSPGITMQGTKDNALSAAGANYPTQDYLEINGEKQGLQKFQFGIVNNTDESITNAISVLNLPQVDTADSNNETAKHEFTLNISGAGTVDSSPVNNVPNDAHTLYYATQMATLSADGQTVTFADGTTWTKGEPVSTSMLTADQVTDWSQVKALILFVPSMTKESELLYDFSAYSPTSLDNAGKQAVLTQVVGYDGQASLLKNSVTDTYAVYASMTFVDQAGNQINGHPTVTGQATLNQQTGTYDVVYPDLVGVPGEALKLGTPETITGYKYVQTINSSPTFKADGSTLVTRVYQVDQAKLLVGSLQGTLLATATGDPNANTGSNYSDTPTGVTDIVFGVTDDQLTKPGYTYTVTVVDLNGKRLTDSNGQSQYQTLAQALVAQGVFDATSDKNGATQNFIVNYEGVFQQAVIISSNDPAKLIPSTITVAQSKVPFYSNGKSGELMFYDETTQTPLISDDTMVDGTPGFKRENYRYSVLAPDGKTYDTLADALAAKLTFDNTDNTGQTDSEIQVYQIIYEEDLQNLRVTIIDDQGNRSETGTYTPTTLVAGQALGTGLSNTEVTTETKQTLAQLVKSYIDQGYILVSQSATPDNYDNDPSVDQEVIIHLAHGTYEQAGETKDVTQTINYLYVTGPNQGNQVAPPNVQQLTFTSTQIVDQVTGEILNTVWSPEQNTTSVTSPVVAGYANDQAVVAEEAFTYNSPDKVITVYYNALEQVVTYTVIDDTTQATLAENVDLATGLTDMPLDSSVADDYQAVIAGYVAQGYVLVSADQLPATYDNDENVAQNVIIHLKHGQITQAGADKVVTQTINYLYGNGPKQGQSAADTYTKSYTFTSVDTIDTVTNEVLSTAWSEAQETETVVSPTVGGYVPSQTEVVSQILTHESGDQTVTVLYTAGTQSVQIHYVDMYGVSADEAGVEITAQMQTLTGDAGSNYTNTLWDYGANGYELISADPGASSGVFDEDPDVMQDYYVYLTHALQQVVGEPVTVNQTINYVYLTGPKAGQAASETVTASRTFVPTYTVDQVTGQNVGEPSWTPDTAEFNAVLSPTIAGYEADTPEVLAMTVTPTSTDSVITVKYNALEQLLTYTVIDDTTQTTLAENVDLATGLSEMPLDPSVADDYQAVIAEYLAQGYDLVSADQLPTTYDNNNAVTQNVTIHLKHGQEEQAGADKVVTQTINYVYGNGPKKDQTAAETYTKSYTFTSVDTVDKVTGEVLSTVWSDAQPTETVLSPTISGYLPSQLEVASQLLTHESNDQTITILYTAGTQSVQVHYIDMYGVATGAQGVEITAQMQTLTGDASASYQNTLWDYVANGYELISADPGASSGVFDEDPDVMQDYYVYLTHALQQVVGEPVTVNQTINYVYLTGPKAGQAASETVTASRTFVPTYTVDQVTGQNVGEPSWAPDTAEFSAVVSPTIAGYEVDTPEVLAETVTPTSTDSVITVKYNALEQLLTYTVIDDTIQTILAENVDLATGLSEMPLNPSVNDDYQAVITEYLAQGYVLVSAAQLPTSYDNDTNVTQNVVIHLAHDQVTQAGADKVVTQTINYVYGNGPKKDQTVAETYTKSYTFTSVDTVDKVTGEVLSTVWSDAQSTETVLSPTVSGYLPNQPEVASQLLTHNSSDQVVTVLYMAGTQSVQVHYIDMYGVATGAQGVDLIAHMQTLMGDASASYQNTLWDYAANGYELISADPGASSGIFDEDPATAQVYYVYLTHALRQVEGTPVTVSQTINYVYGNGPLAGQIASETVTNSQNFVPTYTVDQVTGQNVGEPTWTPPSAKFDLVLTPTLAGYTPDLTEVAEETITPLTPDSVITVTYRANEQRLTYTVIDDTSAKTLVENIELATGKTDNVLETSVNDSYQALIASYLAQGYVLVSADQLPTNFDHDDAVDQNVTVHLAHGQMKKAGTTKIVTQTVEYIYGNGPKKDQIAADTYTKNYVFTSVDTLDSVTGEILNTVWSDAQATETVISPTIAGYLPNQSEVASQTLTYESPAQKVTVLYTAGEQLVKIHYIDTYEQAAGVELSAQMQTLTGAAGTAYTNILWDYVANGYELVKVDSAALSGNFDEDPLTIQDYYVYLTHTLDQVVGTPVSVTQTINYLYQTGPLAGQLASETVTTSQTFVPTYTIDKVTNQNVGEPMWNPPIAEFSAVVSPTIGGYTADKPIVVSVDVTPTSKDMVENVYYRAEDQKVTVTVSDETTGTILASGQVVTEGLSASELLPVANQTYAQIIEHYRKQGYEVVSADPLPNSFDTDSNVDQVVNIKLIHGKKVTTEDKVVTQTINYLYGNGPNAGTSAATSVTKAYTFTATNVLDTVTGEYLSTTWSQPQNTVVVVSPAVDGYLASQLEVASQTLTHESPDQTVTILYTAGSQIVNIHYIDMYNATGEGVELTAQKQTLTGDAGTAYQNTLWDYVANGYELLEAQPQTTVGEFDEDPTVAQDYYVYLTHALKQVDGTPVTVSQTINYVYGSGPNKGQPVGDSKVTTTVFVPTYTIDQVTKQPVGEVSWGPETVTLGAVNSPTIAGYTADQAVIPAVTITPTSENISQTVYYTADTQRVILQVTDDETGEVLVDGEVLTQGESGSELSPDASQTYEQLISEYQKRGYQVVSATDLPPNFDTDSNVDQIVTLKLVHAKKVQTGADKVVKQTINYLYGNGPMQNQSAAPSVVQEYRFTSTMVVDAVTGAVLTTTWSDPQSSGVVISPMIQGYLPDLAQVDATLITAEMNDLTQVVNYYTGEQTVKIHYIDVDGTMPGPLGYVPSDGHEVTEFLQILIGQSGMSYQNALRQVAERGYKLVFAQPEATSGSFDSDPTNVQEYYVYLVHDMVTSVGEPITITDTVNYVYGNGPHVGQPVATPNVATRTFTPTYTYDKVTGELISVTWSGDGLIEARIVPQIPGYTPDQWIILSTILTPEMKDRTQTVYYLLDEAVISQEIPNATAPVTTQTEVQETTVLASPKPVAQPNLSAKEQSSEMLAMAPELPQTGDRENMSLVFIGLGLLSSATLLGAFGKRRKKKTE